jgi:hypothetical protein
VFSNAKLLRTVASSAVFFTATGLFAAQVVGTSGEIYAEYELNLGTNYDFVYVGGPLQYGGSMTYGLDGNVRWSYRDNASASVQANPWQASSSSQVVFGSAGDGTIASSGVLTFNVSTDTWIRLTWSGSFAGHLASDPDSFIYGTGNIGSTFGESGVTPLLFGTDPSLVIPSAGPFTYGPFEDGIATISYSVQRYFRLDSEKEYEIGSYANLNFTQYDASLLEGDHETWAGSNLLIELIEAPFVLGDFGGSESPDESNNSPDGLFDALDVEGFFLALNDRSEYLNLNPDLGDTLDGRGDFGGALSLDDSLNSPDGVFDALDVEGFLLALNDPSAYTAIQPTGRVSPIPEPSTISGLIVSALALSRRRR